MVGACKRQEFCCLAETLLAFHEFVIHFCLAVIVKQYYLIQNFSHSNFKFTLEKSRKVQRGLEV